MTLLYHYIKTIPTLLFTITIAILYMLLYIAFTTVTDPRPQLPILLLLHQGTNSMLSNARQRFFWPSLDASVRLTRSQCRQCNENAPSQPKEPPISTPPLELPFEQVATDFCHISDYTYIVYADLVG